LIKEGIGGGDYYKNGMVIRMESGVKF